MGRGFVSFGGCLGVTPVVILVDHRCLVSQGSCGEKSGGGWANYEGGPAQRLKRHEGLLGTSDEDKKQEGEPTDERRGRDDFQFQVAPLSCERHQS